MSDLSVFMNNLEEKIKVLDANIAQSLANHNSLGGYTQAIKEVIVALSPIVEALVPTSVEVINEVEAAVSAIQGISSAE